jgi:hypothetical protein
MVGSGIASSLVHEVCHKAAALLDLDESIRPALRGKQQSGSSETVAWGFSERWISEIIADFWSVARLGVTSTLGLTAVVSLPRPFVFRVSLDDPHPIPWFRVKISCAIGEALYPHPQWRELEGVWEELYPPSPLPEQRQRLFRLLEQARRPFVELLMGHRPRSLGGRSLAEVMEPGLRTPEILRRHYADWSTSPTAMRSVQPSLIFAAFGQARAEGRISPEAEGRALSTLLRYWAVQKTFTTPEAGARRRATTHEPRARRIP